MCIGLLLKAHATSIVTADRPSQQFLELEFKKTPIIQLYHTDQAFEGICSRQDHSDSQLTTRNCVDMAVPTSLALIKGRRYFSQRPFTFDLLLKPRYLKPAFITSHLFYYPCSFYTPRQGRHLHTFIARA